MKGRKREKVIIGCVRQTKRPIEMKTMIDEQNIPKKKKNEKNSEEERK